MENNSQNQEKPQRLVKKTFLRFIRNSVGSKMFRNLYIVQNGNLLNINQRIIMNAPSKARHYLTLEGAFSYN